MPEHKPIDRRQFLKLSALVAGTPVVAPWRTAALSFTPAPAQAASPTHLPPLAVIALNRMAFGPRPGDIEAFQALPGANEVEKLANYVDQQLDPASIDDRDLHLRYARAGFETLHKTLEQLYDQHILHNPFPENDDRHWEWYVKPVDELVDATFLRAVYSRRQLVEVLADFWHNHFNVFGWQDDVAPLFASYDRDVIRPNLLGNFRRLLGAVASHPSMLYYLDNARSSDAGPNENYARELLELHTLGTENYLGVADPHSAPGYDQGQAQVYTDNDVYETARAFTGWRVDDDDQDNNARIGSSGRFLYYKPWHDRFNKIILGRYLPHDQPDLKDGEDVLDMLALHPGTARYICRKLCRRLVSDDPPESLVQAAAEVFLAHPNAPDQLKQVVGAILLSEEFQTTWGQKIKRPFESTVAMLRAVEADFTRPSDNLLWLHHFMGQQLFDRHTPDGYPDQRQAWNNSMSLLYRWNIAVSLVQNWISDEHGPQVTADVVAQTPEQITSAAQLADFWIQRILGRPMPEEARQAVVDMLRQEHSADEALSRDYVAERLPGMVQLILMSTEFQLR